MKALNTVLKLLAALATVAGAIYIVATYGEQIVAKAKEIWAKLPQCPCCSDAEPVEEVVEEPAAEETAPVVAEEPAEEPAPEVVVSENEPVAAEEDFAE